MQRILLVMFLTGDFLTVIYLTFFDGYDYTWWNWIVAVPANIFLGSLWPIYWLVLR